MIGDTIWRKTISFIFSVKSGSVRTFKLKEGSEVDLEHNFHLFCDSNVRLGSKNRHL